MVTTRQIRIEIDPFYTSMRSLAYTRDDNNKDWILAYASMTGLFRC